MFHILVKQNYFYSQGFKGNICTCMNWTSKNFLHTYLKFDKQQCFTVGFKDNFTKKCYT